MWLPPKGHEDIAEELIKAGANLDIQNNEKNTVLHLAVEEGKE